MAKNIKIAGATYSGVPAIVLKTDAGADATFIDTTDATATAGDIVSGKTAYVNGALVTGTHEESGGGGGGNAKNVQASLETSSVSLYSNTNADSTLKLTVAKSGTYKCAWSGSKSEEKAAFSTQLYINGSAYGSAQSTFTNKVFHYANVSNVALTSGQEILVKVIAGTASGPQSSKANTMVVCNLIIEEQ